MTREENEEKVSKCLVPVASTQVFVALLSALCRDLCLSQLKEKKGL
jgi:hypothetical protein